MLFFACNASVAKVWRDACSLRRRTELLCAMPYEVPRTADVSLVESITQPARRVAEGGGEA